MFPNIIHREIPTAYHDGPNKNLTKNNLNTKITDIPRSKNHWSIKFIHGSKLELGKMSQRQPIRNCKRKVIISMKINNVGKTNTREEFVLVDHVLDPVKMRKIQLHNPYVIKVRQESLLHLYGLRFQGGFCCSCEDAQHVQSFYSTAAKSNYHQWDGNANRARNRSESSTNLFDNPKAQRQLEASENEEHDRDDEPENARERVTSHNISAVNGLLGERAPPLRNRQEDKWDNSTGLSEDISRNVNRASPISKNIFFDPMPSKEKIEAYINSVYEQSMKEKAMKQEDNNRSNDLLDGNLSNWKSRLQESSPQIIERRISDGQFPIRGSVMDNPRNSTAKLMNTKSNYDFSELKFRETSPRFFDCRSDGQSSLSGSVANVPRNSTTELTKLENEQGFRKTDSKEDNRKFLQLEKCDRLVNVSESGNRGERARDRSRGAIRLENTFDYTPTSLAIHSSRIPEESQFSRRTEKNVFSALPDNESFVTPAGSFASSEIPLRSDTNYKNINYSVTSSMKSNDFEKDVIALLSKILISDTHSSTASERRQYGFRVLENIANNVSASRNASLERKNLSALAIRNDNASSARGKAGNANVSMRISVVPAFTRLQNLSSSVGISRLEELSALTAATARPADKSSTRIQDSKTRGLLLANGIRGSSSDDYENLYDGRETRKIYNSPERASKHVNLKNGYKFRKRGRKLRKSKDARKFRDKSDAKRFGKSLLSRESTWKRDGFSDGFSLREQHFQKRLRRNLQTRNKNFNFTNVQKARLRNEGSRRKTRVFVDYNDQPNAAHSKCEMSEIRGSGSPRKQVILQSGHSYRKVQPEKSDNPFLFNNEGGKESNVDKRIEDKFARISDVLKEDSPAEKMEIIQKTPENSGAVATSVVASADIPKIPDDEPKDDLFSRKSDKSDEPVMNRDDQVTREYPAKSIDTLQRAIANGNYLTTAKFMLTNNETAATSSAITRKDDPFDYKESAALKPEVKLSSTIFGPFLSSPIMRIPEYNASKKMNFDESRSSTYANHFATRRMKFFTRKLPPATPRGGNVNDYFEDVSGPLRTSPSGWMSSKEAATTSIALNNRKQGEGDGAENARFLGLNNDSSRVIAGNFAGPRGLPVKPEPSLRGSDSVIKPEETAPSGNKDAEDSRYTEDPLLENSNSVLANGESSGRSQKSREKDEIAELVDRIVRQYASYTPVMPGMPTFNEITEAETLPPDEETTVTQFATTSATTTMITDVAFRPSIRPLQTTSFPEEMHDEVSLDETTFADETEVTTTRQKTTITKRKFQHGKSKINISSKGKASKSGKQRQKMTNSTMNIKMTSRRVSEEEAEDHPWHRTTEMQQIIPANKSKALQRAEKRKKACSKSKIDYFRNAFSEWTSSMMITSSAVDDIAQARSKRSDLNLDFSVFNDYEAKDEKDRQSRKVAWNKNGESLDMAEPTELRSGIEKRLAGLDYPANRKSFQHNRENRNQSQRNNVTLQDIMAHKIELQAVNDLERYFNVDAQKKEPNTQGNLKNLTFPKPHHVRDDVVSKFEENILLKNCKATSATRGTLSPDLVKIPTSREDLSGSVHERLEIDRRTQMRKRDFGERAVVDRIVMMRKIAVNLSENARTASANADDLSSRVAEPRQKSRTTDRILPGSAKKPGNRDKSRETDTIVRGAKLMITDDKSETRDLDVTAKSVDKKIPPPPPPPSFSVVKQRKREDASKINENPVDPRVRRVYAREEYLRRPRGKVYDTIREMIRKIKKGKSSSNNAGIAGTIARDEVRVDRSAPANWRRSGRRLLSSGKSSYIADVDDEYYEDDESETDVENDSASDNEAIARRDDLSDLENLVGLRGDRDPRKLAAETDRSEGGNIDAARTIVPEKGTVEARDAAIISDVQTVEQAISSNNYRNNRKEVANTNTNSKEHNIDAVLESTYPAKFNDKILEAPIENEEKSDIKNIVNNRNFAKKKTFDIPENSLRSFQTYEEIDEEPLSLNEKINKDNSQDESLYGTQPTLAFPMTESSFTTTNQNLSGVEKTFGNVDFSQSSITPKNEENIKISLIGRIQVSGGFNQTPVLISFDAIPDRSAATSVSAGSSNTIVTVESTAINLLLDDSSAESTFDLSSITERANDEADDSLNMISGDDREVERMNEVAIKSREKFFDLARGNEEEQKKKENSPRIEKRLDKYNRNSGSDKQVILTDYLKPAIASDDKIDRTSSIGKTISAQADEATNKLNPRSSVSPVRFPDILGSVLINNNSLKNEDAIKESRSRTDTPSIETNRFDSKNTTLHIVPLTRDRNKELNFNFTKDESNKTICCPGEDWRNATSGGCYRMPTTVRKLELPETTSRELQTWSNYRGSDPAETFPSGIRKAVTNDRNAGITRSSSSMQSRDGVSETTMEYTTSKTLLAETSCGKCNNESTNAVRVKNMMAIIRFVMKLLRIVSEEEKPPGTHIGQTIIHVKDTVVNASSYSRNNVEKQQSITDRTTTASERKKQNPMITEWRSTERIRAESLSMDENTFESFTQAPSHPIVFTLPTSSDEVLKDERSSTLFETSTKRNALALSSATSSATPKSFLFYERKSPPSGSRLKDVSRENTNADPTGVKQNSNVASNESKADSGGKESRLDDGQTNRLWPQNQDRRPAADRLRLGKQEIASTTNFKRNRIASASFRQKYLVRSKNGGFRWTVNDTIGPMLLRDSDVSRGALLGRIGAAREDKSGRSTRSGKARRARVSDRHATRTKLLNSSAGGGSPADWIGEHRATARLPVDKKRRESGRTMATEKVAFRRVRGEINRPRDPNRGNSGSDSFKIEERGVIGSDPAAKLSTDDALSIRGGLSSLERADSLKKANAIRYSPTSTGNNNPSISEVGEETWKEHISASEKKRDIGEHRDFQKSNRVFKKRKVPSPTKKKKTKWQKKKRKKGGQRKNVAKVGNQRFKRHLLMTPLESEPVYNVDDVAAGLPRRHIAEERDVDDFRKSAGRNARRRKDGGSRTVDGSEADLGRAQIRGGQDCTDRRHPPNTDAAKYLESAHCLRFSNLWYSVYQLEDPIIEHTVYLQVYEKRALANGSSYWEDLTGNSVVRSFMPSDWARSTGTIEAAKIRSLSPTRK
nr:PREDICTED: uncharacterized protein LOC105678645 [Linepithema humile]